MKIKGAFFLLLSFCFCTHCSTINKSKTSDHNKVVRISSKHSRYFEKANGETWVPVMINYIVPAGQDESRAFATIESYFKNFSAKGGDAMRIWISSPFIEIEDQKAGEYSETKFKRIDRILEFAKQYNISIKFTLHHIRTISSGQVRQPWANSAVLAVTNGGPFKDIKEYIHTAAGKKYYLARARALSDRYKNNRQIFGWELWNEFDAVEHLNWVPFTTEILDSVKQLFPNHLVTQTLGSLHSADAAKRYEDFFTLPNNDYVSLHRYIDPGKEWQQYENTTWPLDSLIFDAVSFARNKVKDKPVVVNEIGAVEANHAGPSKMYPVDTAGVLIHDMIFAPFFCGAAGTGGMWHWDSYIQRQNLWYHYQRFQNAIKGIDPVKERFTPYTFQHQGVRSYGLRGKGQTIIWCRNGEDNWKTELQQGIPAKVKTGYSLDLAQTGRNNARNARIYDPWKDTWVTVPVSGNRIQVPPFLRSVIISIQ